MRFTICRVSEAASREYAQASLLRARKRPPTPTPSCAEPRICAVSMSRRLQVASYSGRVPVTKGDSVFDFCAEFHTLITKIRPVSGRGAEVTMKSPLLIVLVAAVLVTVGTLAVMNNACKSSQHPWCAPTSSTASPHKNWLGSGN